MFFIKFTDSSPIPQNQSATDLLYTLKTQKIIKNLDHQDFIDWLWDQLCHWFNLLYYRSTIIIKFWRSEPEKINFYVTKSNGDKSAHMEHTK